MGYRLYYRIIDAADYGVGGGTYYTSKTANFKASRSWSGSTSSNGAHTHTMTTGNASNGTYGKSSTVQPPSQIVLLCIKYK